MTKKQIKVMDTSFYLFSLNLNKEKRGKYDKKTN